MVFLIAGADSRAGWKYQRHSPFPETS